MHLVLSKAAKMSGKLLQLVIFNCEKLHNFCAFTTLSITNQMHIFNTMYCAKQHYLYKLLNIDRGETGFFLASWFEHVLNLLQDHPITPFGHLIHNKDDSRRKPLHVATDITQITFMAVILKVRIVYFKQQIIEKKIKLSV